MTPTSCVCVVRVRVRVRPVPFSLRRVQCERVRHIKTKTPTPSPPPQPKKQSETTHPEQPGLAPVALQQVEQGAGGGAHVRPQEGVGLLVRCLVMMGMWDEISKGWSGRHSLPGLPPPKPPVRLCRTYQGGGKRAEREDVEGAGEAGEAVVLLVGGC